MGSAAEVLWVFLRLGCTSFGGPVAHLGYFRKEIVERRRWCSEAAFAEVVGIAQSLPGPASSQTGFALGILRAGWLGGLAAWVGFTLPSAVLMLAFAMGHEWMGCMSGSGLLLGLQLVAVAVVAQAVMAMQRTLAPDWRRFSMAVVAAAVVLGWDSRWDTLVVMAVAACVGVGVCRAEDRAGREAMEVRLPKAAGALAGIVFVGMLLMVSVVNAGPKAAVFGAFYRSGALVFGGGHVVLPLLEDAVVARGWVSQPVFLAGYGAAQAMPGPLFTFAGYLGASMGGWWYGVLGLVGIFLPGLLLMSAVLPFWGGVREVRWVRAALRGVNAAVVGVLFAALVRPLGTSVLRGVGEWAIALGAFAMLVWWKRPAWMVVLATVGVAMLARWVGWNG